MSQCRLCSLALRHSDPYDGQGEAWSAQSPGWIATGVWHLHVLTYNGTRFSFAVEPSGGSASTITLSKGTGTMSGHLRLLSSTPYNNDARDLSSSEGSTTIFLTWDRILTSSEINAISAPS